jgi:hypothetical protein
MKILIREEQLKLIEQIQKTNPNILIKPDNWTKIEPFTYKNKPVTLYYDNKTGEFHLNDIGTKNTRQLPKGEYRDVSSALRPFKPNYLNVLKRNFETTNKLNGNDNSKLNAEKVLDKNPYEKNPNAPKTNNTVKPNPVKPNQVGAVKTDPKEQRWVGIWEKFLVKYVRFTGGDKDNLTSDIDKAVYKFISQNNKLYTKNKNSKLGNLEKLMTDGKKGPVHDSFLPPYYYNTEKLPIYFYQKSNIIKEIQKKLGVKQTGIFLNQTESAIVKRIKVKNGQGYNIKYDRRNGITQEIYSAIMSGDVKNNIDTPLLTPSKQNTSLEPVSDKIKTDLSNRIK